MPLEEEPPQDKPAGKPTDTCDPTDPSAGANKKPSQGNPVPKAKEGGGGDAIVHLRAAGASASAAFAVSSDLTQRARTGAGAIRLAGVDEDEARVRTAGDETSEQPHEASENPEDSEARSANAAGTGNKTSYSTMVGLYLKFYAVLKKLIGYVKKSAKVFEHVKRFVSPVLAIVKRVAGYFSFIGTAMETLSEAAEDLRLNQHLKIIISFVQVLGSFASFQVEWPPALTQLMSDVGGLVQFNIIELPKLSCLWAGVDFWSTLVATTLGPIFIFILLALPLGICKIKGMYLGWSAATIEVFSALQDQFFNNFLFGAFLIYPIASLSSLQAFNCHETLDVVRSDMRMPCPDLLSFTGLYSIVCFFIYPIGMPLGFYLVMKLNKVPELARSKKVNRAFTNLLTMYNKTLGTLECRKIAQLVGRVDHDDVELDRRIQRFYRRVALLEHDDKEAADAIETDIHLHRCLRTHFQLGEDEMLDKTAVVNMTSHIVERSNRFVGMETMASISNTQIAMLLEHEWPKSGAAGKGRSALKKDMIKTLFKKFGAPREEPPWTSPFGKYYPDPKDETNREFYYGKSEEQIQEEEEERKREEAETAAQEAEDKAQAAKKELKRQKSMVHGLLKKAASIKRVYAFFKSSGEPAQDEEALLRAAEKRADMIFQLEELVLKMLRLQVIACPVLVWDPNSPSEEEKVAIKRCGMIFSMFQVECWYWELCEMLRKFMMVTVLVFIFPGEPAQIGVGLLIVFAFLVLNLLLQPFATADLNNMQTVSQVSLLLTLFVGLMLVIDKYMQKELDLAASGAWGLVDLGQASLLQLNRLMFSLMGTGVNVFTMLAPPLLMIRKFYLGLGTRQQMVEKARNQVQELRDSIKSIVTTARGMLGFKTPDLPIADSAKTEEQLSAHAQQQGSQGEDVGLSKAGATMAASTGGTMAAVIASKSRAERETGKSKIAPEETARAAPSLEMDQPYRDITAQRETGEVSGTGEDGQENVAGSSPFADAPVRTKSGSAFLNEDLFRASMLAGTSSVGAAHSLSAHVSSSFSQLRLLHQANSSTEFQVEAEFAAGAGPSDATTTPSRVDTASDRAHHLPDDHDVDWWALERRVQDQNQQDSEAEPSSSKHEAHLATQRAEDDKPPPESAILTRAIATMGSARVLTHQGEEPSKSSVERGSIRRSTSVSLPGALRISILPDPEDVHEQYTYESSHEQAIQGVRAANAAPRNMLRHPSVRKLEKRHVVTHLRPSFGIDAPLPSDSHLVGIGQSDYDLLMELTRDEPHSDALMRGLQSAGARESEGPPRTETNHTDHDESHSEEDDRREEEVTSASSEPAAPAGPASNGT